jgi:lipopolysaccharide exporter
MQAPGYLKPFITLVGGTAMAQVLSLLCMPFLTRLYEPELFGQFAIYYAISQTLGLLAHWRFDIALMLPPQESEAADLAWVAFLNILVTGIVVLAACVAVFWFADMPVADPKTYVVAIVASTTLTSMLQTLCQWHNRRKNYRAVAIRNTLDRAGVVAFSFLFFKGPLHGVGLIVAQTLSLLVSVIYLFWVDRAVLLAHRFWSLAKYFRLLQKYRDFPFRYGWGTLAQMGAYQIPPLLFASSFSLGDVGFYNLATRVLEAPITLFANSFSFVFFRHVSQATASEIQKTSRRLVRASALFLAPIFILGAAFSPFLFGLLFGAQWTASGHFARVLAPFVFVRILYVLQSSILVVLRKLTHDMLISFGLLLSQVCGFGAARLWGGDMLTTVAIMAAAGSLVLIGGNLIVHAETEKSVKLEVPPLTELQSQ